MDLDHVPSTGLGTLPAPVARLEATEGLHEHVPLIIELEAAQDPQPGDAEQRHFQRRR